MTNATATKTPVTKIPLDDETAIYFIGDWSFDEVDRDPEYIRQAVRTWLAWAEYVGVHIEQD